MLCCCVHPIPYHTAQFPWGTMRWKEQVAPVMAFAGPITFLVFALLSIYTTLILFANSLGVVVSAAHRIAGRGPGPGPGPLYRGSSTLSSVQLTLRCVPPSSNEYPFSS